MFRENADEASLLYVGPCEFAEYVWFMLPQEIQSNVKSQFISLKGLFPDMESCKLTFLRHLGSVFRGELLDMPLPEYLSEPESLVNNCEEQHDIITLPVTTIPSGEIGVVESGEIEVESGETDEQTALREVLEETGFDCELGDELPSVTYRDRKDRSKIVRYWVMNVQSGTFEANEEVDALEWVSPVEAGERLTYDHDVDVLSAFLSREHDA
jgi:hypothetical protein